MVILMKLFSNTKFFIFVFAVFILLIQGCCPDIEHSPDSIYNALTRNELTTFVDSSGNHEQILLVGEGMDRVEDDWNECASSVGYAQFPYAEFDLLHSGGSIKYQQKNGGRLLFPHFSIWYPYMGSWQESYTIQGNQYGQCITLIYADSLENEVYSVIVDKQFGLIMFSYRDQYRWERVLD